MAREIAPLVGADAAQAEQAARLSKADLASGMVSEFPELQGIMGGYYARLAGYPDAVADAVRDHYKPQGPGDSVPTAPVTVAVAIAEKLDNPGRLLRHRRKAHRLARPLCPAPSRAGRDPAGAGEWGCGSTCIIF